MSGSSGFTHFDRKDVDAVTGVRAAAFALTPLILGLVAGQVGAGAIATLGTLNEDVLPTLGAINLTVTEGGPSSLLRRVGPLVVGCFLNAFAFSMGTLVGLAGWLAVPLVAAGVSACLIVRLRPDLFQVGVVTAVVFVVGVGLPGGSEAAAYSRFWLILAGGLWALLGAILQWLAQRRGSGAAPASGAPSPAPSPSEIGYHSLVVAMAVAAGLAISDYAGLVRDYWVMLTVISCVRMKPTLTRSFTVMRVLGTIAGAVLGFATTVLIGGSALAIVVPMFALAVGMFSTRNANYFVFTLFLTAFIILLLNVAYPGDQLLALTRILDTCIGGALALAAGRLLWQLSGRPKQR
ncbi:MAG: FUSC family protein [Nitrososphaerales archaeon]